MKKTLWMLGMAVAALTSCTQSEVLDVPESRVIQFDTFVGKNTRAVNNWMTTDNLDKFYVYGAKGTKTGDVFTNDDNSNFLFNGVEVSRTKTGDVWGPFSYSNLQTWEMDKYYRFAGYSNGNSSLENNGTVAYFANEDVNLNNPDAGDDVVTQITKEHVWGLKFTGYESNGNDLLAAVPAERSTVTNQGVQGSVNFTFEHLLSQVVFRFTYGSTQDATKKIRINEFKLNAIKKANCTVIYYDENSHKTYVKWDSQFKTPNEIQQALSEGNDTELEMVLGDYSYFSGDKVIENTSGKDVAIDINYVIPQNNDMTVTFTVETFEEEGGTETVTDKTTYNNVSLKIANHEYWRPGYVYRYEANLNPQEHIIYFTASVDGWEDNEDRDQVITPTGQNE